MSRVQRILNPAVYHGQHAKAPFFEGWYYKLVGAAGDERYAIIPGVFLGENGHAFIQVLNGRNGQSKFHYYPLSDFWASTTDFEIKIGKNHFTPSHISLDICDETGVVKGKLELGKANPWPVTVISPGIMGWYAYVPKMECYHGVLSFDHGIEGTLTFDGEVVDFSGGRGYIEKDWGVSFPSAWIWMQSNHFQSPHTCLTASVAIIPWLGRAFRGFIIGFWQAGRLHRYASYTGAKITRLEIFDDRVEWVIEDRQTLLEISAKRSYSGILLAPTRQQMGERLAESLSAEITVRLTSRENGVLFNETGKFAGMEVHGELERLLKLC